MRLSFADPLDDFAENVNAADGDGGMSNDVFDNFGVSGSDSRAFKDIGLNGIVGWLIVDKANFNRALFEFEHMCALSMNPTTTLERIWTIRIEPYGWS